MTVEELMAALSVCDAEALVVLQQDAPGMITRWHGGAVGAECAEVIAVAREDNGEQQSVVILLHSQEE